MSEKRKPGRDSTKLRMIPAATSPVSTGAGTEGREKVVARKPWKRVVRFQAAVVLEVAGIPSLKMTNPVKC